MTKFHINKKGKPSICKAEKGKCPFGGPETHFRTKEAAQVEINKRNEAQYSLLPTENENKYARIVKETDVAYVNDRKEFLKKETPAPTYIEKCRSCKKLENYSFYQEHKQNTHHFEKDRKDLANKLENIYGEGDSVGFYEVDHQMKGNQYKEQIIEIKSTGQLIVYDKHRGHIVTTFMGHRARIEAMMILSGEIPDEKFMKEVNSNHSKDLKRQTIDRKAGGY